MLSGNINMDLLTIQLHLNKYILYECMNYWELKREQKRYEENGWDWYDSPYWEKLSDIEADYRDYDGFPLVAFI